VKVLQLSSSFPRRAGDVSGIFILDITETIAAEGVDVTVLAPHDAGAARTEDLAGVHVERFRYAPDRLEVLAHRGGILAAIRYPSRMLLVPPFLLAYLRAAIAATKRLRPDVVHAHWWFPGGVIGAIASLLTRTPLVITLHGSDVHIAERPGLRKLARLTLRRAAVIGVVSEALRREAIDLLNVDPAKIVLLRMPVKMPAPVAVTPALDPPPLRLVCVGRLAREKGFGVLFDALPLVDGPVELDVFGDGPARAELEAAARNVDATVRFHGARPRAELAETLAHAHALVVPSLREGLGMVALEALAVGRPVIASGTGGLVETVVDGDDGILVPPGDHRALADALRRLPLPAPKATAVARHRPASVARAHGEADERAISRSSR
jgi:glycosyltransferase involved in cell wall biosynthesis